MLKAIEWAGSAVRLLDQTKLPTETVYVDITDERQMWDAIKRLVVRGAPVIGLAAAFGAYLGIQHQHEHDQALARLDDVCAYLATSRPTAMNLFWALNRVQKVGHEAPRGQLRQRVLDECLRMIEEDLQICRAIGENGLKALSEIPNLKSEIPDLKSEIQILTHCNAGGLVTASYGTALAPIYMGAEKGLKFHVYADETRPLLQGSRITAYELKHNNIPVTVICDDMAASVMSRKKIDAIFGGADRIAANGDTANKIGTLQLAILAKHFNIPFFVAAPTSTVDLNTPTGAQIPIEERAPEEITRFGSSPTAPDGIDVFNPAFDVTPADLITAIVTERGIARAPLGDDLRRLCAR
jgi:methylthioribose-1-phosphate isomerase